MTMNKTAKRKPTAARGRRGVFGKGAIHKAPPTPREIEPRYMMATTAIHMLGDISSDAPDLCSVHAETDTDYIGSWVCGLGFFNVKFPKATTRPLTPAERDYWNGRYVGIEGSWSVPIKIKDSEVAREN
jgi:hypothetical protein